MKTITQERIVKTLNKIGAACSRANTLNKINEGHEKLKNWEQKYE